MAPAHGRRERRFVHTVQRRSGLMLDARFGGPFLTGDAFTAVDAFFAPVAFRVQSYEPPLSGRARQYVDRLLSLAPMQEWYLAALSETWRDEEHEDEARRAGTWLQDLRHVAT